MVLETARAGPGAARRNVLQSTEGDAKDASWLLTRISFAVDEWPRRFLDGIAAECVVQEHGPLQLKAEARDKVETILGVRHDGGEIIQAVCAAVAASGTFGEEALLESHHVPLAGQIGGIGLAGPYASRAVGRRTLGWTGSSRERRSCELQIRGGEITAQTQQRLLGELADGIGHAVAEVQTRAVSTLPVGKEGVGRDHPMISHEFHHLDLGLLQKPREQRLAGVSQPRAQHQRALEHGGCPHTDLLGSCQVVSEALVARFLEQDRDDRRAVDDHTPSGP
jgi:hypothetical protein